MLAAVLFRRLGLKIQFDAESNQIPSPWSQTDETRRQACKHWLLEALQTETVDSVRNKVCDTVAALYEIVSQDEQQSWVELKPLLFHLVASADAGQRDCALRVFVSQPDLLTAEQPGIVTNLLVACLNDAAPALRVSAIEALTSVLFYVDDAQRNQYNTLLPQAFQTLSQLLAANEEGFLAEGLEHLGEYAQEFPKAFRAMLGDVIAFGTAILQNTTLEERTRHAMLEFLVTLAEAAPGMVKKHAAYPSQVIPLCLKMMTNVDDDEEWYTTEDIDEYDDAADVDTAEHALDRIARALGGKVVLPIVFQFIPDMVQSTAWQQRHGALMCLSSIAEGCAKLMEKELGKIVSMVVPLTQDAHPRVRWALCNCLGQLSTDFAGVIQKGYHQQIMSALLLALGDGAFPRVQTHAAAALVNFCEGAEKEYLEPYLDPLFEKLVTNLQTPKVYLQEQVMSTLATAAASAEGNFAKYYDAIMPILINIMQRATSKDHRTLRGRAIECCTLMALAVGKQTFAAHQPQILELLVHIQSGVTDTDDPQTTFLLSAWARMCRVLGQDFLPYLEIVMAPLIQAAKIQPDIKVLDDEAEVQETTENEDGWEFVPVDKQYIGIKTSALEEKHTALEMLAVYAKSMGAHFAPYIQTILDITLPLFKFYYHDGVRQSACELIPYLLEDAKLAAGGRDALVDIWAVVLKHMLAALASEADVEFLQYLLSALGESIDIMGDGCLSPEHLEQLCTGFESVMVDYFSRYQKRVQEQADEDYDEEQEDEDEEMDQGLLAEMARCCHATIKHSGKAFLRPFEGHLLNIASTCVRDSDQSNKHWAVGLFDDIIEYTGPESWKYAEHFADQFLALALDADADVRQAVAYGVGVAAQFGNVLYADFCAAAVEPLSKAATSPESKQEGNLHATDNAIAALVKVAKFNASKVNVNQLIQVIMEALPLLDDADEAPLVYSWLLELAANNHPNVTGNLPKLFYILTLVLAADILPQELTASVVACCKNILTSADTKTQEALWAQIPVEQQQAIKEQNYFN